MFEQLKVIAKPLGEETSQVWVEGYLSPTNNGFEIIDKNLTRTKINPDTVRRYVGEVYGTPVWESDIFKKQKPYKGDNGETLYNYIKIIWDDYKHRFTGEDVCSGSETPLLDLKCGDFIGNLTDILNRIERNLSYDKNSFQSIDKSNVIAKGTFFFEGEEFSCRVSRKPYIDTTFETQVVYTVFTEMAKNHSDKLSDFLKYGPSESQQQSQAISR